MTFHWRMKVPEWERLTPSVRRNCLRLVGDHAGEWWGQGNAAFQERAQAEACANAVRERLALKALLSIRLLGDVNEKSPLLRAMM